LNCDVSLGVVRHGTFHDFPDEATVKV